MTLSFNKESPTSSRIGRIFWHPTDSNIPRFQFNNDLLIYGSSKLRFYSHANSPEVHGTNGSLYLNTKGSTASHDGFQVSGSSAQTLFSVRSPSDSNIFKVDGTGIIGVGAAPQSGYKLNVGGDIRVINSRVLAEEFVWYSNSSQGYIKWNDGQLFNGLTRVSASTNARVEITGSDDSVLLGVHSATNSNILTVTGSGRVGIGTSTPSTTLQVSGDITATTYYGDGSSLTGITTSPAGSDTQIQFNNSSAFGASSDFIWDNTNKKLKILGNAEITGSDNSILLGVHSATNSNLLTVTGSGQVVIGGVNSKSTREGSLHLMQVSSSGTVEGVASNLIVENATGAGMCFLADSTNSQAHYLSFRHGTSNGLMMTAGRDSSGTYYGNFRMMSTSNTNWLGFEMKGESLLKMYNTGLMQVSHSAASLQVTGASDSMIFSVASPAVSSILTVTGSGNVGIRNTLPDAQWSSANSLVVGGPNHAGITIKTNSSNSGNLVFADGTSGGAEYAGVIQYTHGADAFRIYAGNQLTTPNVYISSTHLSASMGISSSQLTIDAVDNSMPIVASTATNSNIFVVTGSGRVSVNPEQVTSNPTAALNVRSLSNSNILSLQRSDVGSISAQFRIISSAHLNINSADFTIDHNYGESARFYQSGRTRLSSSLGTSTLEVTGADDSVLFGIHSATNSNILTVTGSGRVGIGTNDPQALLHLEGAASGTDPSYPHILLSDTTPADTREVKIECTAGDLVIKQGNALTTNSPTIDGKYTLGDGGLHILNGTSLSFKNMSGHEYLKVATTGTPGATIGYANTNTHTVKGSLQTTGDYSSIKFNTTSGVFRVRASTLDDLFYVKENGNVGINTSSPSYYLDIKDPGGQRRFYVTGDVYVAGSTDLKFENHNRQVQWPNGAGRINTHSNYSLYLQENSKCAVGIANSVTPAAKLHVSGSNTDVIFRASSDASQHLFNVNGDGKVGIGVASPSENVDIEGNMRLNGVIKSTKFADLNNVGYYLQPSNSTVSAKLNGAVIIGGTTPAAQLDVQGDMLVKDAAATHVIEIQNTNNTTTASAIKTLTGEFNPSADSNIFVFKSGDDTDLLGGIYYKHGTGVTFGTTSDERLKKNIRPTAVNSLQKITDIKLYDFEWDLNNYKIECGFVAQNVEEHFPEAVFDNADNMKSIATESLIPHLTKAIQQQQEIIQNLLSRVEELENKTK